jgi:pimeloyl-ACP methyl ester carboxylesterase
MKDISAAKVHSRHEADGILAPYEPLLSTRQFLLTNAVTHTKHGRKVLDFRIPLDILAKAIPNLGQFPYTPPPPVTPTSPQWLGPVLFIRGARADYIREDNIPVCRAFFPNVKLVSIDAGHWVHAEKPKETGDAIIHFVKSVEVKWDNDRKPTRMEGDVAWLE